MESTGLQLTSCEAIDKWLCFVQRHLAPTTYQVYKNKMRWIKPFLPDNIKDFTKEHIEQILSSFERIGRQGHPLSNQTVNNCITTLKAFGRWLADSNLPNPATKIKYLPKSTKLMRVLTDEEYDAVLVACTFREKMIVQFLCNTGLRIAEYLSLKPFNISPDKKVLHLIGKGRKPRVVPLNDTCRSIINRDPNFDVIRRCGISDGARYMWTNKLCKRLAIRAGIPTFTPHALRHTFATRMIKHIRLSKLSKILGHSSTQITEKTYVHWIVSDFEGATDCLTE